MQPEVDQEHGLGVEEPATILPLVGKQFVFDINGISASHDTVGRAMRWLKMVFCAPGVLSSPWSAAIFGYLFAILGQVVTVTLLNLVLRMFSFYRFPSALVLLIVLLAALGWGVGPSLVATLVGAVLLLTLPLPPSITPASVRVEDIVVIVLYALVGCTVSVLTSQVQRERRAALALSQRLETIIETLPDPLILYDAQGQPVRFNKSAREVVSPDEQRLTLAQMPEVLHLRDAREELYAFDELPLVRALRGEQVVGAELRFVPPGSSSERVVAVSATPLLSPTGDSIVGAVTISHDLTALRRAERDVRVRASELEAVIDALPEALYMYDRTGKAVRMNPAGRTLLERKNPASLLHPASPESYLSLLKYLPVERLLQGEVFTPSQAAEVTIPSIDNSMIRVSVTGAPFRDYAGQVTGAVAICHDVTEYHDIEEALHQSEERYRTIVETAHEGIWLVDMQLRTVYTNSRMALLLGLTREEMQGHSLLEFVYPEDEQSGRTRIERNLRGNTEQFEFRFRRSDGSVLVTQVSTSPIRDAHGTIVGALGLFTDLTARKQMEEALQHSEGILQMALRSAAIAVFQQDLEQRYTWMYNPPTSTQEDIVGKTDADFVSAEEATYLYQLKQRVLTSGEGVQEEIHIGHGVNERWELLTLEPLRSAQGTIAGLVGTSIVITERKHLEQRTHRGLEALLAMARVMAQDEGHPHTSTQQITHRLAALTRDVLGCDRLSLIGIEPETERLYPLAVVGLEESQERSWWIEQEKNTATLSESPDQALVTRLRQEEIILLDLRKPGWNEQPNPYGVNVMLVSPLILRSQLIGLLQLDYGGREHEYSSQELALTQAASRLIAIILERERLLATRERLMQERIDAQASALAAREATRLMEEFLGIAGHELRTPLTTIKVSVQLARRSLDRVSRQERTLPADIVSLFATVSGLLERMERQVRTQNRLVNDLLDVSRIQNERLELRSGIQDISLLVRQVIEDQRSLMPDRTIMLEMESNAPMLAMVDEDRVCQVIANYVSNALKYSESTKPVVVCVERELAGSQVRVSVSDQGPGLSLEQQQHLWERFYRVPGIEVRSGSGVGLGLGLHISRKLIEQLGGQVGMYSQVGQGATFWFTLPLSAVEADA